MYDLKFDEKGLIPVVTVDAVTNEVLMQAYMNEEALQKRWKRAKPTIGRARAASCGIRARKADTSRK